jgi:ABC-type sugar transport system ATPase subunit
MNAGVLQQVAPPAEVYARPANVFVAGFIGNPPMNLLDGTVRTEGDATTVVVDEAVVVLPADLAALARSADATDVVLGVRPEHVQVDPDGALNGTVAVVEALGHERHLVCTRPDGSLMTVRVTGPTGPEAVGDELTLSIDAAEVHLFDRASGTRIGP